MPFAPVAVVGRACLLPGASSPEELWRALAAGRDLLGTTPDGRWRLDRSRVLAAFVGADRDCALSDRGGYVLGFEEAFDPRGFGIDAPSIASLDPLFQWTLHTARQALRDARHEGRGGDRTGLVLGNLSFPSSALARFAEAVWLGARWTEPLPDPRNRFMSGLPASLAARALGLAGRAFAIDAACASSLYAVKLACDRLHDGEADLMLAGAVNRADDLFIHVGFSALKALSPTGRSRPLHREADGLVPAEGAAFVVLKRLDDARRDGDTIHGVIRGVGLSNDGRGVGLLAPSEEGQRRALRRAYEESGLRPDQVSLLECHATGTAVGDATELRSTGGVFAGCHDVPIGSIKSNLGHLITVAGLAGLIKTLEAFKHGVRPPTLHAEAPLEELATTPFRLLTTPEPWDAPAPRRAGVSAFGFGGNNAHLVVEEWLGPSGHAVSVAVPAAPPPEAAAAEADPIALVGLGVVAAGAPDAAGFARALFSAETRLRRGPDGRQGGAIEEVVLDAGAVRFPPRDLHETLPQQLLLLRAAQEAVAQAGALPRERTAVVVGMQCDAEVARYGARWRLAEWAEGALRAELAPLGALERARDAFAPPLSAAGVVGTMPNVCANRLNSQLDARGPSLTVSAEELSGVVALRLAARALRAGEIDAAVVGAVDVCSSEPHARAAEALLPEPLHSPGDAAVVLVARRLSDAERAGNPVLALLADDGAGADPEHDPVSGRFGHAHAASGLLRVAAAALALSHRARPGNVGVAAEPLLPSAGPPSLGVEVLALGGGRDRLVVSAAGPARPVALGPVPRIQVFSGADRGGVLEALRGRRESRDGPARLAVVAADAAELQERLRRAERLLEGGDGPVAEDGIAFCEAPLAGELGFVFAAPAGSYRGMGRELLLAMPALAETLGARWSSMQAAAGWVYDGAPDEPRPEQKLWGSSLLCQVHAELTRGVLGLRPDAAIGFCSGETNALYALGAWTDMDAIVADIEAAGIYSRELAGSFDAVRRHRGLAPDAPLRWASHRVLAPLASLREALADEPLAHLAIVNAPGDAVVVGDADACERVLARIGRERSRPLGYDMAVHCPELAGFADEWRRLHRRRTRPVPGVRFYTHASCDHYELDADSVADALLGQALGSVDFPRLIEKAWRDGVRVFVEHGPQGGCSRWIGRILGDRPHLAVALDQAGVPSLRQAADAVARLAAAGVSVDLDGFHAALERASGDARPPLSRELRFPVARRAPRLPEAAPQAMPEAPSLPPLLDAPRPEAPAAASTAPATPAPLAAVAPLVPIAAPAGANPSILALVVAEQSRLVQVHRSFLARQAEAHRLFLSLRPGPAGVPGAALLERAPARGEPAPFARGEPAPFAPGAGVAVTTTPAAPARRAFDRAQLIVHSSGRISEVFGPLFEQQDVHPRQVRMPEPPLLLADRVTALSGEPGTMGRGSVATETDVAADGWYLHAGRMPAGVMIEAGQADLFLISWLGVDFLNRGERVYRLLGCELTYRGGLPRPGETLRYDIHVDGHARQGEARLFFFHYDCRVGEAVRLSVREGQAGFFSDEELRASRGVLWDPADELPAAARLDPPAVAGVPTRYGQDAVRAFAAGRVSDCFGPAHAAADSHVETPRIAAGRMLLVGEVQELLPAGGPWGRGYLRAVRRLDPNDWFYAGHFKNDPCMPGTLMFEGCLQTMAFYLAALGFTLDKNGWRFEPVPDLPYQLRCRGQATPESRELTYELFVSELHAAPEPTLYADLLCTVDGVKAFHCRRLALRLVPDTPMARRPEAAQRPARSGRAARGGGLLLDYPAMLACAWGPPSAALGPRYARFDGARRMPRLPGPPYHFVSRVTRLSGEIGALQPGAEIEVDYEVEKDGWYFSENGQPSMPFCVLLEANLQPCGWLALGTGIPLESEHGLHFRNLDGTGTLWRELGPDAGTLTTRVRLRDISRSGGMSLLSFDVRSFVAGDPVYEMTTGFGFFPREALINQLGLPTSDEERSWLARESARRIDLAGLLARAPVSLPGPKLLMLDRITGHWPEAGPAGLGRFRAEKDVRPGEWFFKAHFFQDPVQPGSLGLQALLQLLQCAMIERGQADGLRRPRFEPVALGRSSTWKYRGQVVPGNRVVTTEIELRETGEDAHGRHAVADGWLSVDGVRIYSALGLAMRIVPT